MTISRPVYGLITQGTIFTCAIAERYPNCKVHGITITARCDVANDKFPVLNYIPVVPINDWVHCDGRDLLLSRVKRDECSSFEQLLRNSGISASILNSVSRSDVVASYFEANGADKKFKGQSQQARALANNLERLEALDVHSAADRDWLISTYPKHLTRLIRELVEHKLQGYYFLREIGAGPMLGYVGLLREVSFLPRELTKKIAEGVDKAALELSSSRLAAYLSFDADDFAMPVGQLLSPDIEHLLQSFSLMFGRIGLDNPSPDFVAEVCNRNFLSQGPKP